MERRVLRRRRPALSCISCRRRKIKCDRGHPCGQCVAIKGHCAFRQLDDGSEAVRTPNRSSDESVVRGFQRATEVENVSEETTTSTSPDVSLSQRRDRDAMVQILSMDSNPSPGRTSSLAGDLSETGRRLLARQSGLGEADVILNKSRILRWSSWVGAAKEFQVIGACFAEALGQGNSPAFQAEATRDLTKEMGILLAKCKAVSRKLKAGRPARCLFSLPELLPAPSRDLAEGMVKSYFDSFEACLRIMHAPTLWVEYETLYGNPQGLKIDQRLRVLIAIAVGSSLCTAETRSREGLDDKVHNWIYAAEIWLSGPLEKDRLSLGAIQLHALVILARQVFSIGGDLVWTSVGSLVHRAMQIGLHRDPKNLPPMSMLEAEVRRRVWATVIELALQASMDSALPPRISLDEFDTESPANTKDEHLSVPSEVAATAGPTSTEQFTPTSVQIALLESFPVRLQAVQRLNGLRSALTYSETLELSKQILKVCQTHARFMRDHTDDGMRPFHKNMLDYLVRRLLIPLHCPFAHEARTNPVFHYSLKMSLEAAIAIISPEPDEGYSQLMLIAGGMFREGIRYANTVIGLEIIAQAEAQTLEGTCRGGNGEYLESLKRLIHRMTDLATKRIAHGESNVKSHMFMKMILAQVSCIEKGIPCEHEVAKGARDSLQLCYEMLMERSGNSTVPTPSAGSVDMQDWNDNWAGFDLGLFLQDTEAF